MYFYLYLYQKKSEVIFFIILYFFVLLINWFISPSAAYSGSKRSRDILSLVQDLFKADLEKMIAFAQVLNFRLKLWINSKE